MTRLSQSPNKLRRITIGERGIRTLGGIPTPVFKTGAFNRSAISPCELSELIYHASIPSYPYCKDQGYD